MSESGRPPPYNIYVGTILTLIKRKIINGANKRRLKLIYLLDGYSGLVF
jgi:hypothetical protein